LGNAQVIYIFYSVFFFIRLSALNSYLLDNLTFDIIYAISP